MQKTYLFFNANWNAAGKCIKINSIGYTNTVLFLTIGKPDIYQQKSLGKSATVFLSG
jgi:hypothetical protein